MSCSRTAEQIIREVIEREIEKKRFKVYKEDIRKKVEKMSKANMHRTTKCKIPPRGDYSFMLFYFIGKVVSVIESFVFGYHKELNVTLLKYSDKYNAALDDEEDSDTDPGSERSPQSNEEEPGLEDDQPELGGDVELGNLELEVH